VHPIHEATRGIESVNPSRVDTYFLLLGRWSEEGYAASEGRPGWLPSRASDEDERARSVDGLGTRPDLRRRRGRWPTRCGTGTSSGLRNGRGPGVVEVEAAATKRGKGGGGTTETLFFFFNYYYYSLSFLNFFIATLLCKNIKVFSCTYCTIIRHVVVPPPSILSPNCHLQIFSLYES